MACSSPEAAMRRANAYYVAGDYSRAKSAYTKLIDRDHRSGVAYYGLGRSLLKLGDYSGAVAAFRRALEIMPPTGPEAQISRVEMAYSILRGPARPEDLEEVEKIAVSLCRADPQSFDGRRLLGALAFHRAFVIRDSLPDRSLFYLNDALEEYRIATTVSPNDLESAQGFAKVLAVKGDLRQAEHFFAKVVSLGKDPESYADLYRVLLIQGKLSEAHGVLYRAATTVKSPAPFWGMLLAHEITSEPASLRASIAELEGQNVPGARVIAGDAWYRTGNMREATREYSSCLAEDREFQVCQARLLYINLASDDKSQTLQLKNKILARNPNSDEGRMVDAFLKFASGDWDRAESELLTVTLQQPYNALAHYYLARTYMITGPQQEAERELQKAIQLRPGFRSAQLALMELQFALGEYRAAHNMAKDLLRVFDCPAVRNVIATAEKGSDSGMESWGDTAIRRLGAIEADVAGEYLMHSAHSTGQAFAGCLGSAQELDSTGVYLQSSLVDEALAAVRAIRDSQSDRWAFGLRVPGRWE